MCIDKSSLWSALLRNISAPGAVGGLSGHNNPPPFIMIESLIESTLDALLEPANRKNGIRQSILDFMKPAFEDKSDYKTVLADPSSEDSEELIYDNLETYLTGEPDRIEALQDILDRQDGWEEE